MKNTKYYSIRERQICCIDYSIIALSGKVKNKFNLLITGARYSASQIY